MQLWINRLVVAVLVASCGSTASADALQRLKPDRLRAVHEARTLLDSQRRPVELQSGYDDYRAVIHAHSHFSHDSRGQLEEIIPAAHAAGVQVIMFTEHPADHYDYFEDGHRGLVDGVLLIPGAETQGFLAFPTRSIQGESTSGPQEFSDLVTRDGGRTFLCHLEERMDWEIDGMTGSEIYNTHADVMAERGLLSMLRNPLLLLSLRPALEQYPQEVFGAILDYPADYLRRWDELCQHQRLTGIAGNDSHHNQSIRAILGDDGLVRIEDGLGEVVATLDPEKNAFVKSLLGDKQPGETVIAMDLDPYDRSFRHTSTHLLMNEQTEEAVWDALENGRAYVAFDWLADPTGFVYLAEHETSRWPMGSEVPLIEGLTLRAAAPLPGIIKLIRNGEIIREQRTGNFEFTVDQPGNYRIEVWLVVADELKPWILSNPIYVRPGE